MAYIFQEAWQLEILGKMPSTSSEDLQGSFIKVELQGQGLGFRVDTSSKWWTECKIRCYTCNELGHFTTECKKPK